MIAFKIKMTFIPSVGISYMPSVGDFCMQN